MRHNYNNDYKNEIAQAILQAEWSDLVRYRYDGDPGDVCLVENLDLAGRRLGEMPTEFICFKNCNLASASFSGKRFYPQSFWGCDACRIDLRNTSGMLFAYNTDFRGALFDAATRLVVPSSDLPSAFKNCVFNEDFKDFLNKQGVLFDFPNEYNIETYGFGATKSQMR